MLTLRPRTALTTADAPLEFRRLDRPRAASPAAAPVAAKPDDGAAERERQAWQAHAAPEGLTFYFNTVTHALSWDKQPAAPAARAADTDSEVGPAHAADAGADGVVAQDLAPEDAFRALLEDSASPLASFEQVRRHSPSRTRGRCRPLG
jgi:hypothetical protein